MHAPSELMQDQLYDVIKTALSRGGKIIIPSFALERTQEIVFALNQLRKAKRLAAIPVYVDSPLAHNLTQVFRRHGECFDSETIAFDDEHGDPFGFDMLTFVNSVDESKQLNEKPGPMIIISASGMCEGGRIVHHFAIASKMIKNTIVIVATRASILWGRRIVERHRA